MNSIVVNGIRLDESKMYADRYVRVGTTEDLDIQASREGADWRVSITCRIERVMVSAHAVDADADLALLGALETLCNTAKPSFATRTVLAIVALQIADGEIAQVAA